MSDGVRSSAVFVLFLSKDVLQLTKEAIRPRLQKLRLSFIWRRG